MERRSRVHLDHPTIRGRMRAPQIHRAQVQTNSDIQQRQTKVALPTQSIKPAVAEQSRPVQEKSSVSKTVPKTSPNITSQVTAAKPAPVRPGPNKAHVKQPQVLRIRTTAITRKPQSSPHIPRQTRSGVLRRQMVRLSKPYQVKKHRSYKPYLAVGLSSFLFVIVGFVGFAVFKKLETSSSHSGQTAVLAKQTTQADNTESGTSGSDMPTENNSPTDISSYTVAAKAPRFLTIDKLGVSARVRRVGTDADSTIKGPSNIFDVGWYENSTEPGDNGTTLIDGHTSGETKRGVFYGLNTLKKGDKIVIERGDGKRYTYTVAVTEQTDFDSLDKKKVMSSYMPGKPGLNLMTATGRYNVRTNQYEKRVVVYAVQD